MSAELLSIFSKLPVNQILTGWQLTQLNDDLGMLEYIYETAKEIDAKHPGQGKLLKTVRGLMIEGYFANELSKLGVNVKQNTTAGKDKIFWYDLELPDHRMFVDTKITSREINCYKSFTTPLVAFADTVRGPGQFNHLNKSQSQHHHLYLLMINMYESVSSQVFEECEYVISPSWFIHAPDFFKLTNFSLPKDPNVENRMRFEMEKCSGRYVKFEY